MRRVTKTSAGVTNALFRGGIKTMTANEFAAICVEFGIDPGIALENDEVRRIVKCGNLEELREVMKEQF